MAVNVSKIPNRKDFDAVREAILQVDANVSEILDAEGLVSSVAGITGDVLVTGDAVSVNVATKTITINAGTANDGVLTIAQGSGITISDPNTFSANQSTNRTITITNSSPDQIVTWSQVGSNIAITGNYPNFAADLTDTVTISGTLTAGNLTTGGTLTATNVSATNGTFTDSLTLDGKSVINELSAKGAITFEGVQQISANTDAWGVESQTWESSTLPEGTTSFTILHQDTSSQADVYNTGGNVIQSIGLDTYGHLGSIGSTDLDQRYLAFKTISVGGTALEADAYNDTLSITSSDGITLTTGNDSFNIAGDDKFKFIYTSNDNNTAIPDQFNDTLTFLGSGAVSVTKSATENEIRFGLAVSDIRFEDGIRVSRGFVYYVGSSETVPTATPTGSTFDFTSDLLTINDSDFSLTPPITGYNLTTYYIARFTSRDEGAGTTESRSVTYSAIEDATGFESPVTFNALTEGLGSKGFSIIDGGNIKTGIIQSIGINRANFDAGTSVFTQRGSFFDLGSGDIVTPNFSITSGNAVMRGVFIAGDGTEVSPDDIIAAQASADAAQSTADSASTAASNAQSDADAAQTTADNAATAASNAQSTADTAKNTTDKLENAFATISNDVIAIHEQGVTPDYDDADTPFYVDSSGNFSLGQKLLFNGTNLNVTGQITVQSGSTISSDTLIDGEAASVINTNASNGNTAYGTTTDLEDVVFITSTKIYQGAGNFGLADTGFYLDDAGQFSLKDKLSFNGTTLTVDGNGTFTGTLNAGDVTIQEDEIVVDNTSGSNITSKISFTQSSTEVGTIKGGNVAGGTVFGGLSLESLGDRLEIKNSDAVNIEANYLFNTGRLYYTMEATQINNLAALPVLKFDTAVTTNTPSRVVTAEITVGFTDAGVPKYYKAIYVKTYILLVAPDGYQMSSSFKKYEEGDTGLGINVSTGGTYGEFFIVTNNTGSTSNVQISVEVKGRFATYDEALQYLDNGYSGPLGTIGTIL